MKSKWKYLNSLTGRETKTSKIDSLEVDGNKITDSAVPNEMNKFYLTIPDILYSKIGKPEREYLSLVPSIPNSIFLNPTTVSEVKAITYSLGNTNNLYDVPAKFLKIIIEHIADILCTLYNDCMAIGQYPDVFQVGKVVPIYKQGSKVNIGNYRPISLLPTLNKIFEKILHKRIYDFLSKFNIFSDRQFGFREGYNTELASFELIGDILPSFDDKMYTMGLFIDFEKAFDTLDRNLLLEKCWRLGLRGSTNKLLKSYFARRQQFVHVNDIDSDLGDSQIGCVQGSNLGPLMFIIYANDIHNLFEDTDVKVITYADDTVLYLTGPDVDQLYSLLIAKLKTFLDWCKFNKLSINYTKTKIMVFSSRHFLPKEISFNDNPINTV